MTLVFSLGGGTGIGRVTGRNDDDARRGKTYPKVEARCLHLLRSSAARRGMGRRGRPLVMGRRP